MPSILIRTRNGEFRGELDDSDVSNAFWLSLPFSADINMLGSQIYFTMNADADVTGDATVFDSGDIAYWPDADAMCLFFGPTPLSGDDRRPVSAFPLKRIGRLIGDCSGLEHAGDRQRIVIERVFN